MAPGVPLPCHLTPNTTPSACVTQQPMPIHIFNGFMNPHGGSELEALALHALLCDQTEVHLRATSSRASRELLRRFPIRRIRIGQSLPAGGTYIFVGAHWRNKLWPYFIGRPRRLIYVYNTFHPKAIGLTATSPRLLGWPTTEYVLISEFQKGLVNAPGTVQVHPSPIDINRFSPQPRAPDLPLVIGRMSRDTADKHDDADTALYRELAAQGHIVCLQGATCIADRFTGETLITATAEGAEAPESFLRKLSIFYYRSGTHVETFGRVVFEAMACGVPVVCHAHGGYADSIRHGENGFLFRTTDEARAILARLSADPALSRRIGAAGRVSVEQLYSATALQERAQFYLAADAYRG